MGLIKQRISHIKEYHQLSKQPIRLPREEYNYIRPKEAAIEKIRRQMQIKKKKQKRSRNKNKNSQSEKKEQKRPRIMKPAQKESQYADKTGFQRYYRPFESRSGVPQEQVIREELAKLRNGFYQSTSHKKQQ